MTKTLHALAKFADLRKTADTLDYVVLEGQLGEGEACLIAQMAKAIRADVDALELVLQSEHAAEHVSQERSPRSPNLH